MTITQFVQEGLQLFAKLNAGETAVSLDNTIRVQRLYESPLLTADLIAHSQPQTNRQGKSLGDLARLVNQTFNLEELKLLCEELSMDFENLSGETRIGKSLSLVQHAQRHGHLPELISTCSRQRTRVEWPDVTLIALPAFAPKENLVIVVNLASRYNIELNVPRYLDEKKRIDANFVYFQNPNEDRHISYTADWNEFQRAFTKTIKQINDLMSFKQTHIFVSGSGAILFSLGCMWGSVKPATCYHFEDNTYFPLIEINKKRHG